MNDEYSIPPIEYYCECEELVKMLEITTDKEMQNEICRLILSNYNYNYKKFNDEYFNDCFSIIIKIYITDDRFNYDCIIYTPYNNGIRYDKYNDNNAHCVIYAHYYKPIYDEETKLYFAESIDQYMSDFIDKKLYEIVKDSFKY